MICHIVENGGYTFLILCFCLSVVDSTVLKKTIQDFCSSNLYLHNIELGEPYKLILKSDNSSVNSDKWLLKSKRKCRQDFKASDADVHFVVTIYNISIPSCTNEHTNCGARKIALLQGLSGKKNPLWMTILKGLFSNENRCFVLEISCNYFEISAAGHNKKRYCGNSEKKDYTSKSDQLSIEFHYGTSTKQFDVTFDFTVQRNSYYITGRPKENSHSSSTYIETPYFPNPYPANYRAEYLLQSDNPNSHVLLLFLDFQISHQSYIEISGNNGTHPTRFYGNTFRPPAVVSQSNRLMFKFISNDDQDGMPGFRAQSSFIKNVDSLVVPYTDCSGSRDGRGGVISIKTHKKFSLYDCVWHIMPFTPFTKSNRSVSTHLLNIGHKSVLEFRSGFNSKSKIVKEINCESENVNCSNIITETIAPASENLYIRFIGYLDQHSVINMSYSTYHMGNCSSNEFRCQSRRCLLSDFRCDGIKQCPDGTDEELCPSESVVKEEFPFHPSNQSEGFHSEDSHKFLTLVLLGTLGLVTVCVAVCVFAYIYCKRNNNAAPSVLPQAADEMSDIQPISPSVNLPDYDKPPSYEDFVKSAHCYPPPLYTRANRCIFPKEGCTHYTTSFCTGARARHHSANFNNFGRSDVDDDDMFLNIPDNPPPPCMNSYNVEIIQKNLSFKKPNNSTKRYYSLDSKLNDLVNQDSCHFLLSIVHPVPTCGHMPDQCPQVQFRTLPANFKVSAFQSCGRSMPKINKSHPFCQNLKVNSAKDRSYTWSFIPRSSVRSEIVTVVKARCFSDPCNGISVHCSLH